MPSRTVHADTMTIELPRPLVPADNVGITPQPRRRQDPLPAETHRVLAAAEYLSTLDPGTYDLAAVYLATDAAGFVDRDVVRSAMRYLGYRYNTINLLVNPVERGADDGAVLARLQRRNPELVTSRVTMQLCQWRGMDAWRVRGHLSRLETAGHLEPHRDNRNSPTTRWRLAQRPDGASE
jgi:hypothetical protein